MFAAGWQFAMKFWESEFLKQRGDGFWGHDPFNPGETGLGMIAGGR